MKNALYNGGKKEANKYIGKIRYHSHPKNVKQNWLKLKEMVEESESLLFDFDAEVWMYGSSLAINKKIDLFRALDLASERIGKLREKINKNYPIDKPELREAKDRKYYSELYKLILKT